MKCGLNNEDTSNLEYKDLLIIDHAIRAYTNRDGATKGDILVEKETLNKVNDLIKIIKTRRRNEKTFK